MTSDPTAPAPAETAAPRRRSWLATPLMSLLLAGLLMADVLTLPAESTAGAFVQAKLRPEVHCEAIRPPMAYLVNEGAGLRLASFNDPLAHEFRSGQADPEIHRAILSCEPEVISTGFWAVTRASFDHTMTVRRRQDGPLPAPELDEARAMFVPYAIENGVTPEMGEHMARGDGQASLIRWDGYLRNAGSLLVGIGLILSLRWVIG